MLANNLEVRVLHTESFTKAVSTELTWNKAWGVELLSTMNWLMGYVLTT